MVDGIHKNAELSMSANTHYHIGSNDACDIILMDKGVAEEHLTLFLMDRQIYLKKKAGNVFIDGDPVAESKVLLRDFQVVTVGQAHFAIGPAADEWPILKVPILLEEETPAEAMALMVIPDRDGFTDKLRQYRRRAYDAVLDLNRKVLLALAVFVFLFFIFWIDFFLSDSMATADQASEANSAEQPQSGKRRSMILSFIQVMMQIREKTLVDTGVYEPHIDVTKENNIAAKNSAQVVREVLEQQWGPNLIEFPKANGEVEFKGHDSTNQTDLHINLNRESDGSLSAEGYTHSRKQRKEILAQLGDVIRLRVTAADDLEHLSLKEMQRKKIKDPNTYFDIDRNAITLEGRSSDQGLVAEIEKIVAKILPDIQVDNQVRYEPSKLDIVGASTSGVAYVKIKDGSKIFPGGKLKNGCTVVRIDQHRIVLNCKGSIIYHNIGDIPQ